MGFSHFIQKLDYNLDEKYEGLRKENLCAGCYREKELQRKREASERRPVVMEVTS